MEKIQETTRIALKNILYLTDFSESSQAALPFAAAMARNYGATIHVLHVLTPVIPLDCPVAVQADEDLANAEMQAVDRQLQGVDHDTTITEQTALWPAIERAVKDQQIDLLVLGTHGRTGARKLMLGSFAEEIFRRSSVPVMTIGPDVRKNAAGGDFHSVLFATDFSVPCQAAAPFAVSLAEENDAQLRLLYVGPDTGLSERNEEMVAGVGKRLLEIVPEEARSWCRPSIVVRHGEPTDRILEAAIESNADLIVLGVKDPGRHLAAATHFERAIAHKVVAYAKCPVLTVRG